MDKFFDALDKFFGFVRKHYGMFFWLCLLYLMALGGLQLAFEVSETIVAIAVIPLNLFTWPVFLEARKLKGLPLPEQRLIWALPMVTTLLPLLLFFGV